MIRRLAAILAADVSGYSRLMGEDEAGTLSAVQAVQSEVIDPVIARHRGRLVKLMGDGILVEFASVIEAVQGAVEIQRELAERNRGVMETRRIEMFADVAIAVVLSRDPLRKALHGPASLPIGRDQVIDAGKASRPDVRTEYPHLGRRRLQLGIAKAGPRRLHRFRILDWFRPE